MKTQGKFQSAYIECLLWAESGDPDSPLGVFAQREDFAPKTWARIEKDCAAFLADPAILNLVERLGAEQCGHDFWLTRNGHGAGFWDRGYSDDNESALMAQCKKFPPLDVYYGDDALIYFG